MRMNSTVHHRARLRLEVVNHHLRVRRIKKLSPFAGEVLDNQGRKNTKCIPLASSDHHQSNQERASDMAHHTINILIFLCACHQFPSAFGSYISNVDDLCARPSTRERKFRESQRSRAGCDTNTIRPWKNQLDRPAGLNRSYLNTNSEWQSHSTAFRTQPVTHSFHQMQFDVAGGIVLINGELFKLSDCHNCFGTFGVPLQSIERSKLMWYSIFSLSRSHRKL